MYFQCLLNNEWHRGIVLSFERRHDCNFRLKTDEKDRDSIESRIF